MSLLYIDGFDAQDTAARWMLISNGSGSIGYTSSTRLGVGKAVTLTPNPSQRFYGLLHAFTASAQIYTGAAIQIATINNGNTYSTGFLGLLGDGGTTSHLYLTRTAQGAVALWRGNIFTYSNNDTYSPNGTQLAISLAGILDSNWHYVELSATISATTGAVTVKVDGTIVLTFTGDTKNGGTNSTIDAVGFNVGAYIGVYNTMAFDDVYICNSLGSTNNTFLGDVQVQTLLPTAAGSSTQLTPTGSANNYANVNDVPDSSSTYNSSSTSGQRDTYTMGDLSGGTGTIYAVQQVNHAFKTTSGTANLKAAQQSGATVSYGAVNSLGTATKPYTDIFETNPATGVAYTSSDVNGLEAGAEVA